MMLWFISSLMRSIQFPRTMLLADQSAVSLSHFGGKNLEKPFSVTKLAFNTVVLKNSSIFIQLATFWHA